jgi:hypothetical protein
MATYAARRCSTAKIAALPSGLFAALDATWEYDNTVAGIMRLPECSNSQQERGDADVSSVESRLRELGRFALVFCRQRKRLLYCHPLPLRPGRLERRLIELRLGLF